MLVAGQNLWVGSLWTEEDSLRLEQGDCFRKKGRCQNLECQVQTLDLVLTGVWRG